MEQDQNFNNLNQNNDFVNQNLFYNQFNLMQMNPLQTNPNQMQFCQNMMNNQIPMNFNRNNEYKDIYDYIKEEKKRIIFRRVLDNQVFKVLIPKSLRNDELYMTSIKYKQFKYSEIQLYHNDTFLNNDEEDIDYIKDGDEVKIIEQIHGVDFRYYKKYLSKHNEEPKINIKFSFDGRKINFSVIPNTSIEELIKIFFNHMKIPQNFRENSYYFRYNGNELSIYEQSSLTKNGLKNESNINVFENSSDFSSPEGKIMEVIIKGKKDKEDYKVITNSIAGTLQEIRHFYDQISVLLGERKSIIKMIINDKEIQKDDKSTFSSNGIRENFTCFIEFKYKDNI